MDLTDKETIIKLLKTYNLWAKKRLGQNFLICRSVLADIIQTSNLSQNDTVLEVGPGLGVLTCELCKHAGRVIAVEKDRELIKVLRETTNKCRNVRLIEGDIFRIDYRLSIIDCPYKVVANIPYYLTSHLIQHFLQSENPPKMMVLMVQKEVAERIIAKPPKMELLSVMVQFYAGAEIVRQVPRSCFFPEPEVDSAIIKLSISDKRYAVSKNPKDFFRIVKAGFSAKRKTLSNALAGGLALAKSKIDRILQTADIDPKRRAETLSLEEWARLAVKLQI